MSDNPIMDHLKKRSETTPDITELDYKNPNPNYVFVYGTLKRGYGNNYLLKSGQNGFMGVAATKSKNFSMYRTSPHTGFPVVFNSNLFTYWRAQSHPSGVGGGLPLLGAVYGEVYSVDAGTMARLDSLEANGVMYQREQIDVELLSQIDPDLKPDSYGAVITPPVRKCWAYIGVPEFWWENRRSSLHEVRPCTATNAVPELKNRLVFSVLGT